MTTEPADLKLEAIRTIVTGQDAPDHSADYLLDQCNACIALVEQSSLDQEEKDLRVNELISHKCLALIRLGRLDEAERIAAACLRLESPGPGNPLAALVVLAEIAMQRGEWEKVLTLAKRTRHLLVESPVHFLGMLGRHCQALKRFPDRHEEGVQIAKQGMAVASAIGHVAEEAIFSLDLAQFLQLLCRYSEAKTAAELALGLCRESGAVVFELSARGILGQCCLDLGDPDAARSHAMFGFERAGELKMTGRQAVFLDDLAEVALVETNVGDAVAAWLKAITLAASVPAPGHWLSLTRKIREMVLAQRDAVMAIEGLAAIIDSTFDADPEVQSHALPPAVGMMKDWYDAFGHERAGTIMDGVLRKAAERRGTSAGAGSSCYCLLLDFASSLALLSKGRLDEALALADVLDRASDDRLRLRSSLEALRAREPIRFSLGRWFSGPRNLH